MANVKETNVTELNMEVKKNDADVPFTGGHTEAERMGQPLEGLFKASGLMLVQKKKSYIGSALSDSQEYYYTLSFSDTENMFTCTSGKIGDDLQVMHIYDLGFNYIDKKLKLVDFILLK